MAALDPHTRGRVRAELRLLLRELGLPTIIVTHDFLDAAALADRIAVLVEGRVVQIGIAEELIARPANAFVAELAGGNLVHGTAHLRRDGLTEVVLEDGSLIVSTDVGFRAGRRRHPSLGDLDRARGDRGLCSEPHPRRGSRASSPSATAAASESAR